MTGKLFRLELSLLLRDTGFRLGLVLFAVLLIFAVIHQQHTLEQEQAQIAEVMTGFQTERATAQGLLSEVESGARTYSSLWDDPRGYYTWRRQLVSYPQSSFNFLAVGQRDLKGPITEVSIYKKAEAAGRDLANPVPRLLGTFDPAFVFVFLLPLLMIGITQGILSREREAGTLPMLLSNTSTTQLLLLKSLPRLLAAIAVVLLSVVLAVLAAGVNPLAQATALGGLCALLAAYTAFWFLAALALNLWVRSSAAHAVALTCLWFVVCLLAPAAVSTLSKQRFPMPAHMDMVNEMRAAAREQDRRAQEVMAEYYHDHPELSAASGDSANAGFFDFYRKSLSVNRAAEGAMQPTLDRFTVQRERQQEMEAAFAKVLPPALVSGFLEEMAGSSARQYGEFDSALAGFSLAWRDYFQAKAFAGELINSDDPINFPHFTHQSEAINQGQRVLLLCGYNLLLLALIGWRLRGRAVYDLLQGSHG